MQKTEIEYGNKVMILERRLSMIVNICVESLMRLYTTSDR